MVTIITIDFPDGREIQYKLVRSDIFGWGISARPWFGPPYYPDEVNWQQPGEGVHDLLESMAPDGSEFWLHLADGGSVHFIGDSWGGDPNHKEWSYQAKEVFDPHGFKTTLIYDAASTGQLTEIHPEAGRWLKITWGYPINGSLAQVIRRVELCGVDGAPSIPPSPNGPGSPAVDYTYLITGNALTLRTAEYGGGDYATYRYQGIFLMEADDPRFAGAMTWIRYKYRMDRCQIPANTSDIYAHFMYVYAQPEAIAEEQSPFDDELGPIFVSRFGIGCWTGTRTELNGLGGWRNFYYGHSATWPGADSHGHELAKVTDFAVAGANAADVRQNHKKGDSYQVWDGRNIMTQLTHNDSNGELSEIRHSESDGSFTYQTLNWTDPGSSEARDPARIHNPHPHWLFSKKDELNHETIYTRDARWRITRIQYPGSEETFAYNEFNQITTHQLPSGAVVTYVYDSSHRLWKEYNSWDYPASPSDYTEYAYYGDSDHPEWADLVKTKTDGLARERRADFTVKMTYTSQRQVATVEYASTTGQHPTVSYTYDPYGNCTSITDELGHVKTYTFDFYRRCTSYTESLNAPDWNGGPMVGSRRWDWTYDRYVPGIGYRSAYSHTKNEWRLQIEPPFNDAGDRRVTERYHDVANRVTSETTGWKIAPNGSWEGSEASTTTFTYDENGQKKTSTDSLGRRTSYDYDVRNRLWKVNETDNTALPRTTETLYDAVGNKLRVNFPVEATGRRYQQWLGYDAFGQPGQFRDERGNTTDFAYQWGPMKKLITVTTKRSKDAGGIENQPTTFSFDKMGRPLKTTFPDLSYEENSYKYSQVVSWRTRKGQTKFIHYDIRGREDSNSWQDANGNCNLTANNEAADCIAREWDAANRLSRIRNRVSTINYTYDDASQVWTESDTVTGAPDAGNLIYLRYPDGEMAHVHYPNGIWVRHDYTARGQLKRVYDSAVGWKVPVEYSYLSDGKVNYADYADNTHTDYRYDPRGFTSFFLTFKRSSGQEIYRRNYYRDERDRITAVQRGTSNPANLMENGRGDHFWYDEEGQLVESYYGALDPANNPHDPGRSDFYSYDELGNRKGWNYIPTRGWTTFTRKDNGLNQYNWWYPMPAFYDQDLNGWGSPGLANGVLMQDGNITAGYNALNQMVMVQGHSQAGTSNWTFFGYDPLGRRVQQWVGQLANGLIPPAGSGATFFYYDGWNLVQEGSSAASASRNYVYGARVDEIVKQITPGNWSERYFHYEARGHCAFQTDPSGNIMEQYDYDAFGWPYFYDASGNNLGYSLFGNRFLFTGREWLSDLKLYDFRNRMYQPELGRFMQPDPKEFAAGDYNLYRYCHNDPVNRSDPLGLKVPELDYGPDKAKDAESQQNAMRAVPGLRDIYKKIDESPIRNVIKDAQSKDNPARPGKNGLKPNYTDSGDSFFDRFRNWLTGRERTVTSYVDPHNRITATGNDRPPIFGMANELGEMYEANVGIRGPTNIGNIAHDNRTIEVENIVRGWFGAPHRSLKTTDPFDH